ncbi:MAG TPA: DUF4202 family protein [Thermoanaerobaculia bacterium]|jgi:hypothetical protein|nr:DUF4202 family protein [Thermoanaerobaculia bacterium]
MAGLLLSLQAIFRSPSDVASVGSGLSPWGTLAREFPRISSQAENSAGELPSLFLALEKWESQSFNFYELDGQLDALAEGQDGPFALVLLGNTEELARSALGALTRCQRWMDRRNEASQDVLFDRVLEKHRQAHDLAKPLVRADYNHALDTWQWVLRLAPDAGLDVQLAALLHDVERLISEADARAEHRADDYQRFKDAHAARGAELAESLLAGAGCDEETRRRTARLIAVHEHPPEAEDGNAEAISLLNDADALSFFSLNSVGYLDYFGPEATRKKVEFTLRRLRPAARRHLAGARLPGMVSEMLAGELVERMA